METNAVIETYFIIHKLFTTKLILIKDLKCEKN